MKRTAFQEKIHALLELPEGIPPKLDPRNDDGDPELYTKMVAIDKDRLANLVAGFQMKNLSAMLGKSVGYVGTIKRGKTKMIPYETAERLAELISCEVEDFGKLTDSPGHNSKRFICVETGEVFGTVKEAADAIGGNYSGLAYAIKNGTTYKGYHWRYAEEKETEN